MSIRIWRIPAFALLASTVSVGLGTLSLAATVYTETNSAAGNAIQIYRTSDGPLALANEVSTGGLGTDSGLGSQGALALTKNGRWLFAVNAGSNEISAFKVTNRGLSLVSRIGSGGTAPISLTVNENLLYVLNAGGTGNITGFRVGANGILAAVPNSTRPLSSASAGGAEVSFDRDGELLVVTEKATNSISTYRVREDLPVGPAVHPSSGKTPFGFDFDRHNNLLVSEAFGGAPGASAISSYDLGDESGSLQSVSASVPAKQTAACWVALARHGKYAYVTNTGSGSITGFRVDRNGGLAPLNADGVTGTTLGNPIDAAVAKDGQSLFVLTPKTGAIVAFSVQADGSVRNLGSAPGAPLSAVGLIAR